jgi:hypothetical protein
MTDVQDVQEQEQPRLSLQRRLGIVLSRDDHVGSDEIRTLIQEVTNTAAEASVAAQQFKAASLSVDCEDVVAADSAQKAAMLERQRLLATLPRLEDKLRTSVRRENHDRYRLTAIGWRLDATLPPSIFARSATYSMIWSRSSV